MLLLKRFLRFLWPLALVGILFWAFAERQAIYDWWQLRGYTPPSAIVQIANQDTMTDQAKHDFYVNHPELIANKAQFQQACSQTEQTIVLGCYKGGQRGIDIYAVSDNRLAGIEQVTAAHEMLHSAYDRLSSSERKRVDSWLQDYYQHNLTDQRILKTIASYKKTEPKDVVNEMHSIFATEISHLPTPLEQYYKRYFTNRSTVVAFSDSYEGAFTSLQDQASSLLSRLKSLQSQITSLSASLSVQRQSLEASRGSINSQAEANSFNAQVRTYNSQVQYLNNLITQYNNLRDQYNALVVQQQELFNAINTQSTVPAQ